MRNLHKYIQDPYNPQVNFSLALEYNGMKHYAGAASHFLRCAEFGDLEKDKDIIYESLLHLGLCFQSIGDRPFVESGFFLQAMAFDPERPEAYWLMSQFTEWKKQWQESYTYACMGLNCPINNIRKSNIKGYEGEYMLLFQKAIAAWWIGRTQEARDILFDLPNHPLNELYLKNVQNNLSSLGSGKDPFVKYTKDQHSKLKFKFKGSKAISKNYSQTMQDMFTLAALDGKYNGYYLEIGSADPFFGSNTALLEQSFAWDGISIEIDPEEVAKFKKQRKNKVVCKDATLIEYDSFLKGINAPKDIDYLQLDCEPPETTYDILLAMPFETYRFAVITFEHDYYADASRKYRDLSRTFLTEKGYILIASDIAPDHKSSFEDWWVHPELVDEKTIRKLLSSDGINYAGDYMLT